MQVLSAGRNNAHVTGRQLRTIDADAWVEDVAERHAHYDGDGGDDLKVEDGFKPDFTQFFGIPHPSNADDQRRYHNGHHDHLDQV